MKIRKKISFLLNDKILELDNFSPSLTLLDFLRLEKNLNGTKEGCNEGDCGACTVLVGRLVDGKLIYESVNACIRFIGSLDGTHIVSIEHLKSATGELHPIQLAIVKYHASQCGFCTPGIILSLYGLLMSKPKANKDDIEKALQGNLCRCTGYASIIRAVEAIVNDGGLENDLLINEKKTITKKLQKMQIVGRVEISNKAGEFIIPKDVDDLALLLEKKPNATLLAGSTDIGLWVNKDFKNISPVIYIASLDGLKEVKQGKNNLIIGAANNYSQSQKIIKKHFPQLADFLFNIGGNQIRNMGTFGGNIANGSPIADLAPPLFALGASLNLRKGKSTRKILLEDFYIAYGKQDLQQGEFIQNIEIPYLKDNEKYAIYKISKRKYEDISTVCASFKLTINNDKITKATLAYGGMAAKPSRAKKAEQQLLGQPFEEQIIEKAALALPNDFVPIDDVRATAQYRLLIAQNLLRKFYLEQAGLEQAGLGQKS